MIDLKAKIASGVATAAILSVAMAPSAFAETFVSIHGNGSHSDNEIDISGSKSTSIVQNNSSRIVNDVNVSNNTGGNSANDNTGGEVSIQTGDASSEVEIVNHGNSNVLDMGDCGCHNDDLSVVISGNGYASDNEISIDKDEDKEIVQNNDTYVTNDVNVDNNTGYNEADDNTGGGFFHHPFVRFAHDDYHHGNHNYDKHHDGYYKYNHDDHDYWMKWFKDHYGDHNWHKYFNDLSDGEVSIQTGDAESDVEIHNYGGHNVLE
jgi:hypothetical protein